MTNICLFQLLKCKDLQPTIITVIKESLGERLFSGKVKQLAAVTLLSYYCDEHFPQKHV